MGNADHYLEFRASLPTISHAFPYHGRKPMYQTTKRQTRHQSHANE